MTAKLNQPKRLDWVLATIVLLIFFSTSLKAMDSKATVARSASQHALRVGKSGARVKRYLRSTTEMTKRIDSHNEDRAHFIDFFQREAETELLDAAAAKFEEAANDVKTTKRLFGNIELQKWIGAMERLPPAHLKAKKKVMNSKLLSYFGDETLLSMIATGKTVEATKVDAENFEIDLMLQWMEEKQPDRMLNLLRAGKDESKVVESPLWTSLINHETDGMKEKAYKQLFNDIKEHFGVEARVRLFSAAKYNDATKELGIELGKLQTKEWLDSKRSASDVFEILGLDKPGNMKFESLEFDAWAYYLVDLQINKRKPNLEWSLGQQMLSVMREKMSHKALVESIARDKAIMSTKATAKNLENLLEETLEKDNKRAYENDDNTLKTRKRQHRQSIDDDRQ